MLKMFAHTILISTHNIVPTGLFRTVISNNHEKMFKHLL